MNVFIKDFTKFQFLILTIMHCGYENYIFKILLSICIS